MKKILIFLFTLLISKQVIGQTVHEVDQMLTEYLKQISYWSHNHDKDNSENGDSLSNANGNLETYISTTCIKLPIDSRFPLAERKGLDITLANDHKLKVFTWDTQLGGTQYYYSSVILGKTKNGVFSSVVDALFLEVSQGDTTAPADTYDYYDIAGIKLKNSSMIYLFFGTQVATRYRGEQVFACKIVNDELVQVPFFKTKSKLLSSIGYAYDLFAFGDKNGKSDPPIIHLSKDKKKLYIPLINGHEKMTNNYLVYVFDGNNFVFDKNAK